MPNLARELNLDKLNSLFCINDDDRLVWKVNKGKVKIGDLAGSLANGYYHVMIDYNRYSSHRIIYQMRNGIEILDNTKFIDHVNGDTSNNSIENIRMATYTENQCNRKVMCNNKCGLKGVHYEKDRCKWIASIQIFGKKKNLGRFNTKEEAHEAYKKAALELHGEFANFG